MPNFLCLSFVCRALLRILLSFVYFNMARKFNFKVKVTLAILEGRSYLIFGTVDSI